MITVETGNNSASYLLNGVPQQRGGVKIVHSNGSENVGLREIASNRTMLVSETVHYSEWQGDGGATFASAQEVITYLEDKIFK
jgi:hypothetical protein